MLLKEGLCWTCREEVECGEYNPNEALSMTCGNTVLVRDSGLGHYGTLLRINKARTSSEEGQREPSLLAKHLVPSIGRRLLTEFVE
jgi:hypothetical protein